MLSPDYTTLSRFRKSRRGPASRFRTPLESVNLGVCAAEPHRFLDPSSSHLRTPTFVCSISTLCCLAALAPTAQGSERSSIFVDVAADAGVDFVHFNGMSGELYLLEIMGSGGAFFDYDNDGDLDAYLVQGHMIGPGKELEDALIPPTDPLPLSDRLFRNDTMVDTDGSRKVRFVDVTESSGIGRIAQGYGMGVSTGDYDNDGWVDLYLSSYGSNQLLRNRGDGTFEDVSELSRAQDTRWSITASFVDYDRDGFLDLYVVNYVDFSFANHHPCTMPPSAGTGIPTGTPDYCGPLAYTPLGDRLLHNRGDGTFEDVSLDLGIQGAVGSGLGATSADFDKNGWPDVYVANDGLANFLWMNRGEGRLEDEALLAGCAVNRLGHPEASMGVVAEDADGDGDVDLFLTHLAKETNTLFLNDGTGLFLDLTTESGLGPASFTGTGFGTGFFDYDNDGDLDIFIANGAVALIDELVLEGDLYPLHQRNKLFRNLGGLRYEEATEDAGPAFELSEVSRGVAFGDVDRDGDTDVLLTNNSGPARLLLNQVGQDSPFLGLRLLERNRDAYGALMEIRTTSGLSVSRRIHTDGSYASARAPQTRVGLGTGGKVGEVRVRWPSGASEIWRGLVADRYVTLYGDDGDGP